ncbi:hypothetical protein [Streptomyces uncialis]|uniref:hypothetical protein n=1 Tax=Streptomyces uncialis TaxID=1048205 RepID=UPI00386B43FB|nr:hypothetical protein OG924_00795 [Streptomyces uncialis]
MTSRRRPLGNGPQEPPPHPPADDEPAHSRVSATEADLGGGPLYRQDSADELEGLRARGLFTAQPRTGTRPGRRGRSD